MSLFLDTEWENGLNKSIFILSKYVKGSFGIGKKMQEDGHRKYTILAVLRAGHYLRLACLEMFVMAN